MRKNVLFLTVAFSTFNLFAQTQGTHGETIDANGIITAPPADAELRSYDEEGKYVVYGEDEVGYAYLYPFEINRKVEIAVCTDGTYFIKDPVSQIKTGAWVYGTCSGNELHVPAGQKLLYDPTDGTYLQTFRCLFDASGDIFDNYEDFIYTINPMSEGGEALVLQSFNDDNYLYNFLGAVWTNESNSIEAIGDYEVTLTYDPANANSEYENAIVLPDNIELKPYNMHAYSYLNTAENNYKPTYIDANIRIGFVDDDMYIAGFYYFIPEFVIKGKRNGNVITFPQHQFLGYDGRDVEIYAISVKYAVDEDGIETFVDGENWTLTYDPASDCYYGDEDGAVRFSRDRHYRYGNMYETLDEILIYPSEESNIEAISTHTGTDAATIDLNGCITNEHKGLMIKDGKIMLCK